MNAAIAKVENNPASEPDPIRPDLALSDSLHSPPLTDEVPLDEQTGRRIYRRSAAYFLFGFGYNRHEIITDEP